jgi:hypothetical protein
MPKRFQQDFKQASINRRTIVGGAIKDSTTLDILVQLNKRFDVDAIPEMVALQKEFKIFSAKHSLRQSFALLGIVPADQAERTRWYRFLDELLGTYKSDLANVNGHDRVVKAFKDDLAAAQPLPVFFRVHLASEDPRVTVTQGPAVIFSSVTYSIVSIPTIPASLARQQGAEAAKKRRTEKNKK